MTTCRDTATPSIVLGYEYAIGFTRTDVVVGRDGTTFMRPQPMHGHRRWRRAEHGQGCGLIDDRGLGLVHHINGMMSLTDPIIIKKPAYGSDLFKAKRAFEAWKQNAPWYTFAKNAAAGTPMV